MFCNWVLSEIDCNLVLYQRYMHQYNDVELFALWMGMHVLNLSYLYSFICIETVIAFSIDCFFNVKITHGKRCYCFFF